MAAGETVRTITLVAGPVVDASGAVLVDAGGSGVEFVLATNADVNARIADAAVGGRLATFSVSAGRASAEEIAQQVDEIGVVQTRLRLAETDVLFNLCPVHPVQQIKFVSISKETGQNLRMLPGGQVHLKLLTSSVQARRDGRAFVDFVLTEGASQSWPWPALAVILVDLVQASVRPYGIARIVQAFVNVNLALDAQKSWPALELSRESLQAPAVVDGCAGTFCP